jgi:hypothetical protein
MVLVGPTWAAGTEDDTVSAFARRSDIEIPSAEGAPKEHRLIRVAIVIALFASVLAGCSRATPIPPGAQVVLVAITASTVRLDPSTVRAGDVYLEIDEPLDGSITFVERQRTADETPGPLDDGDLARLARGDVGGFSISGFGAGGCSADQDAEDRGKLGPCGTVFKVVLVEGRYAIVGGDPAGDATMGRPPSMAVLEVLP